MRFIHRLFTYYCVLCGDASTVSQDLCIACRESLPILTHSCVRCAREIVSGDTCRMCEFVPPPFDKAIVSFAYSYPITHLILTLKFNQALIYGKILGELLSDKIAEHYLNAPLPDIIIPVPLHASRLKERGFNQAHEIALPIAKRFQLPLDIFSCERIKATSAQATLDASLRQTNLSGAFVTHKDFSEKTIALLDDVITTGSTARELATLLKKAGAKETHLWCVARAKLT